MRTLYLAASIGIIALGLMHVAAAFRIYGQLSSPALWFVSGGLTLILTGVLNLLRRAYGRAAPGLRRACIATNAAITGFSAVSGRVGHASTVQMIVVVGLFGATTLLSLTSRADGDAAPT